MHIGLFGGAFDPPHNGHKKVAQELLKHSFVDQVWFVPVFQHPWAVRLGKEFLSPYDIRLEMVRILADSVDPKKTHVAEFKDVSFVYPTLEHFAHKYPEHTFSWIMGSEYLPKFDDFLKDHPKLLDYHFFVYPRQGVPFEPKYENMTFLSEMEEIDLSSSEVKEKVMKKLNIDDKTVIKVANIVSQSKLYLK